MFLYPVANPLITNRFGDDPTYYSNKALHPSWSYPGHNGIDFAGVRGDSILSVLDGTVLKSSFESGGYGNYISISHEDKSITYYAHLESFNVSINQSIPQGYTIGFMGDSGCAFGVHLHFGYKPYPFSLSPSGYRGYADPFHLFSDVPLLNFNLPDSGFATSLIPIWRIRSAPSLTANIVGYLPPGIVVQFYSTINADNVIWLDIGGYYAGAIQDNEWLVSINN